MLSDRTVRTLKSSAPILREQGLEITQRMYERLFQDEQIKSLFNQSHHGEEGMQPRALAGAIHAYADNADRLESLGPMIERIAQKHVALNILPEHYPYVGQAIIGALRDVLGQAATDEVIAAWTEAYEFLADVLINREAELYEHARTTPGGWLGWREFVVDRVDPESDVIKSFYLKPRDGEAVMPFRPGQYLTFQIDVPEHGPLVRNYSVSCAPGRDLYRISVKREAAPADAPNAPAGLASNHLHDRALPGAALRVSAPAGEFFLDETSDCPVVLLSGGVGLTPMVSMLEAIVDRNTDRPVWFVHAAVNGRHHAMKEHVRDLASAHDSIRSVVFYEFPTPEDVEGADYDFAGRITIDQLKRFVPMSEADFYFCGPKGFMRMLALGLRALDVPEDRLHFEFFGPPQDLYA